MDNKGDDWNHHELASALSIFYEFMLGDPSNILCAPILKQ